MQNTIVNGEAMTASQENVLVVEQYLTENYQEKQDLADMISACFRKPEANETVKPLNSTRVLQILQNDYTTLKITQGAKINVGRAMKELGVETCNYSNVAHYRVVPMKTA